MPRKTETSFWLSLRRTGRIGLARQEQRDDIRQRHRLAAPLRNSFKFERCEPTAKSASPHSWHVGSRADDRRYGHRVGNISCPRRRVAGSWEFGTGCIAGLAGGRSSFAVGGADLRRTQRDEAASGRSLRLHPRLFRTVPCFSLRLDHVLRDQCRFAAIKVGAILSFGTVLLWRGTHSVFGDADPAIGQTPGIVGFGLAMISVLWAYEGWQYVTYAAGETVNPQRVFPRAFLIGTAALIAIYIFANLGYVAALGASGVAGSTRVAASALGVVVSHGAGKLVAIAILVSMFSAANAIILNAPRVYYAMAKDGLFFVSLSRVHPRFGTPALAVCAAAVWSAALAASGTYEQLLTYVVFIGWMFYALAAASIFIYRKRFPDLVRTYRVPGYPFTPALFIAAALALVINTVATQPMRAAIGLGIVFLGAPAYLLWRRSRANSGNTKLVTND